MNPPVLEFCRRATVGVAFDANTASMAEMGLTAPLDSLDAVRSGLSSVDVRFRLGPVYVTLPPWFSSRGLMVPSGVLNGGIATLLHILSGASLTLAASAAAVIAGHLMNQLALIALGALAGLLVLSLLVHELGHIVAYRGLFGATAPAIAVVKGIDVRITRLRGSARKDLLVALAGPFAPAVVALALVPLWGAAPFVVLLFGLIAVGHMAGLLIPAGDGMTVRELVRQRRQES